MAAQMLHLLIRHDVPLPAPAVGLFFSLLIHDALRIRKVLHSSSLPYTRSSILAYGAHSMELSRLFIELFPPDADCHKGLRMYSEAAETDLQEGNRRSGQRSSSKLLPVRRGGVVHGRF